MGTAVTARLCQELLSAGIEWIGLNVDSDNCGALAIYEKLGSSRAAEYGEYLVEPR